MSDDPDLRDWMGKRGMTTYWGRFARVLSRPEASIPLVGLSVRDEKDSARANWTPLVASSTGRGRCVYFSAAMDAGYPYQRRLLVNAVRWAAAAAPPITVDAPHCVLAGFFTRPTAANQQVIVHLLNDINSTTGHGSVREKQFAIREEIVPTHDVLVTFSGTEPSRVLLIPDRTVLKARQAEGVWRVTVPRLDLHAVIVAEYDAGKWSERIPPKATAPEK